MHAPQLRRPADRGKRRAHHGAGDRLDEQAREGFRRSAVDGMPAESILSLFEAGLARWPSRIAARAPDRELTFRELDAQANAVAAAVLRRTGGEKRVVGVLGESSPETLAAFLG